MRIGISAPAGKHPEFYCKALRMAGAAAEELVVMTPVQEPTAARLDGLLLTGGADVDPARYGEPMAGAVAPQPERDRFETALLAQAWLAQLPVLAICRGIQLVNVALGGTLRQHVDGHEGTGHDVMVDVARLPGPQRRQVNSRHHQVIKDLAPGLSVLARSDDGCIEAVGFERERPWFLAVQWHPEDRADTDYELALFRQFVQAVQRR